MPDPAKYSARIVIENDTDRPRMVWVEPWAEDFTLRPKEELEIIAQQGLEPPWFRVSVYDEGCSVSIEGSDGHRQYDVRQEGQVIQCGHQRRVAIDAGLRF